MADAFVIPCTEAPKRPFWKSRPNYDLEYAGGAYKRHVELDFESIPEYPHDKAQWMSSQTQFQLPMIVEPVSPFSMSSALPLFKQASYKDAKSVNEPESSNASISQSEQSHTAPEGPLYPLASARRYGDLPPLPVIPERSSSGRLSAAEPSGASGAIGRSLQAEARALYPNTQDGEMSRSNSGIPPVLTGPDSGSSTHSGVTSDSAPRTPPPTEKDYFGDAISRTQPEDYLAQPDGIDHEVFPAPPHSYMSSPSTLYLRDSWGQFVLDAQSHYVSASGSVHGAELRSNKPPSTIEERGEKWTGEVPNVWSLFSQSPTSGLMDLPPSPVPAPPHNTLSVNPIFAHILWDVRFPPASASLIMPKFRKGKYSSELWSDDEGSTRALARVEVMAPATYPPTPILLISSSHTRWRARVEGEGAEGGPKAYVTVADVMFALHEQLSLRFVKQSEWDKLNERTKWYVGRAYGRNRLGDMSDAGSVSSGFSGSAGGDGQSMNGSIWSEGSRMSGESIGCGPGTEWGPGIRRADVLRDRTMFAGLRFDPSYKRRARGEEGMFHLVMNLRRHEPEIDAASVGS